MGDKVIHTRYDAFGGHSDPPRTHFLDDLPELDFPWTRNQSRREQRQESDPLREAARRLPQWGPRWPEVCNCFNAARDQVFKYFTDPKIEDYWCSRIAEAVASTGSTCLFPELPVWSDGKSKVYAAMAICVQVFTHEVLIPKSVQETEWYKLNHDLYWWVRAWDAAPKWMIRIEQDLRKQGLFDHAGKTEATDSPNGKLPDGGNAQTEPTPADESDSRDAPCLRSSKRFTIALSFPGERRDFAGRVASYLAEQVGQDRVLYDKYHEAGFARINLDTHLQQLYHDESELIVVFLCSDYDKKDWCGLEWRAIRDLLKGPRKTDVMLLRFDEATIPGLYSIDGYIPIGDRPPAEITDLILQRLGSRRTGRSRNAVKPTHFTFLTREAGT